MDTPQALRSFRPLVGLSPAASRAAYSTSGMHSPNPATRLDADAFEIRNDVCVEDACCTALRLMRMAVAQLELLGVNPDLGAAHRDVVDGIACLGRLACGTIGVVEAALSTGPGPGGDGARVGRRGRKSGSG